MDKLNVTNPQPSSPLNLLYKGVFSTRIGKNHKSKYGQYLDKLHHIEFLGIGTYSGSKLPDIISATLVQVTSIDGRVEHYRATRKGKSHESASLEVLGGKVERKSSIILNNSIFQKISPVKPLDILSFSLGRDSEITAVKILEFDNLTELIFREVARQVEVADDIVMERLNRLKYGNPQIPVEELLDKVTFQTILPDVSWYDVPIDGMTFNHIDLGLPIFKNVDGTIDFIGFQGWVPIDRAVVEDHDVRVPTITHVIRSNIATYILDEIVAKGRDELKTFSGIIKTDAGSFDALMKQADTVADLAFKTERYAKEGLMTLINVGGAEKVTEKTFSLLHYLLMKANPEYRQHIEDVVRDRFYLSGYISPKMALTVLNKLGTDVLRAYSANVDTDVDFRAAKTLLDGLQKEYTVSELSVLLDEVVDYVSKGFGLHNIRSVTEKDTSLIIADRMKGRDGRTSEDTVYGVRDVSESGKEDAQDTTAIDGKHRRAEISFEHELKAEDSKQLKAVLDALYKEFVKFTQGHGTVDEDMTGGRYATDKGLLKDLLSSFRTGDDKSTVNEYLAGDRVFSDMITLPDEVIAVELGKQGSVLDNDGHGELSSEQPTYTYDFESETFADLVSIDPATVPQFDADAVGADLTDSNTVLSPTIDTEAWGELTDTEVTLSPVTDDDYWGELTDGTPSLSPQYEVETWGELANEPTSLHPDESSEVAAELIKEIKGVNDGKYDVGVYTCTDPDLKYRRRPPLEPDKRPEDPLFEWSCTEGYVCDDWLIVPLKDFNFENPDMDGFYDPVTLEPYYPTGQTDENGDPYVLPPYSVLNEPISNGADVGGKEPMMIDPCNLYSFIEYMVKIYDAYKTRFQASSPVDTISRVLNMVYEQVVRLINEWDDTKGYTPDELWRIYRFIRWMALGITYRFYRVKLVYTYGDFVEHFEAYPFTNMITVNGASRKQVPNFGWVLEGHPIIDTVQNGAQFTFKLPKKTRSSTISFELGNYVPDRPDEIVAGGVVIQEDFEGVQDQFKIKGDGWETVQTQGGTSLGVEHPARARTYRTTSFNVPTSALNPSIKFNYGFDTNMETALTLKRSNGTVVWSTSSSTNWGQAQLDSVETGDYYFEVRVPQAENSQLREIVFDAQRIQNEWKKAGYITEWKVVGDTIYEEENTAGYALVVNEQWIQDDDYEFEFEFYTKEDPSLHWAYDWLGGVFNYRDPNNYYRIGSWSDLDKFNSGIEKVVNGTVVQAWRFTDLFLWKFDTWHKMKIKVQGNRFQIWIDGKQYFDVTDSSGWGHGACGLAAYSNPYSTFRRAKYRGKPRLNAFIDNVVVEAQSFSAPVMKPKYAIDFYLDDDTKPRVSNYSSEGKRAFSFPILEGEHKGRWVFKKIGNERSIAQDASFIDNIVVKGMRPVKVEVVEEIIGCGGHLAVKLLIENLLEYYRRHHQGCKGERNIWIIE